MMVEGRHRPLLRIGNEHRAACPMSASATPMGVAGVSARWVRGVQHPLAGPISAASTIVTTGHHLRYLRQDRHCAPQCFCQLLHGTHPSDAFQRRPSLAVPAAVLSMTSCCRGLLANAAGGCAWLYCWTKASAEPYGNDPAQERSRVQETGRRCALVGLFRSGEIERIMPDGSCRRFLPKGIQPRADEPGVEAADQKTPNDRGI